MAARRDHSQLCRATSFSFLWAPPCWGPGTEDTNPQKPLPEEPTHAQGGGVTGWTGSLVRLLDSAQAKVTPRQPPSARARLLCQLPFGQQPIHGAGAERWAFRESMGVSRLSGVHIQDRRESGKC